MKNIYLVFIMTVVFVNCTPVKKSGIKEQVIDKPITKNVSSRELPSSGLLKIASDVYSFSSGGGYYSLILVADQGVAVIETVTSKHSTELIKAIRGITDKPIIYAFHSHNHWDHASGGKVIQNAGGKTVMHERAAQWLAAHPGKDTSPPDIIWSGQQRIFKLGGITIELNYLGLSHGLGMTVFRVPEKQIAYLADIVTPNRLLYSIVPDFNITEWERTLKEVLELDFDQAVCSHNERPGDKAFTCSKVHVQEHLDYINDLRNAIFAEFKKGTPSKKIPANIELPQYKHWAFYDEYLEMNAYRIMLDLWMGPYPWLPEDN